MSMDPCLYRRTSQDPCFQYSHTSKAPISANVRIEKCYSRTCLKPIERKKRTDQIRLQAPNTNQCNCYTNRRDKQSKYQKVSNYSSSENEIVTFVDSFESTINKQFDLFKSWNINNDTVKTKTDGLYRYQRKNYANFINEKLCECQKNNHGAMVDKESFESARSCLSQDEQDCANNCEEQVAKASRPDSKDKFYDCNTVLISPMTWG